MQDLTTPFEILLVEDDPADAGLAKRALRDGRILCNVAHVRDGVEAMEYLRRQGSFAGAARPDLILLDLNMPRMDGRDVLQELKADDELKTIPVVILTTSDIDRDVSASYRLGANSFITKPMDMDAFFDAVKSIEEYWFRVVRLPR